MGLRSFVPFVGTTADAPDADGAAAPSPYEPRSVEIDTALATALRERAVAAGPVLNVVPYKRERDTNADRSFFRDVHRVLRGGPKRRQNQSIPWAFEPYFDPSAGTVGFRYVTDDDRTRTELRQGLEAAYHDADLTQEPPEFIDAEPGQYLSAAWLTLRDPEALKPINNPVLNPGEFKPDPYDSIIRRMTGPGSRSTASVVTQVVFMPAISHAGKGNEGTEKLNWHYGVSGVASELREPEISIRWQALPEMIADMVSQGTEKIETLSDTDPGNKARTAADLVENQTNKEGYHVNVRVIAIADERATAETRVGATAEKYRNFYNSVVGQGFAPVFDIDVEQVATRAARRAWVDRGMPMSIDEAIALGAPPTKLSVPSVDYTHRSADQGRPADAADFAEYDETGYSAEWGDAESGRDRRASPDRDRRRGGQRRRED